MRNTDHAFFAPLEVDYERDDDLDRIVDVIEMDPDLVAEAYAASPGYSHNHAVSRFAADLYRVRRRGWRAEP